MEIWAIKNNSDNPMEMLKQGEFDSRIDMDILTGKIVQVCGAMTPVYNTTESYTYFHKLFFKTWGVQIKKLFDTMDYEYEPLENYRRIEDMKHTDSNKKTETEGITGESNSSDKATSSTSNSNNNSSTIEDKTSAFNESAYQPDKQSTNTGNVTGKEDRTDESNGTSKNKTDRSKTEERNNSAKDDNTIRGLNGLFTTQQLIKQEREIAEFNVYQWIVNKYMEELFICIF